MNSKTLWHTIQIKVPAEMIELTKTGKVSVKKTLTKTFNISKSQKKPAIKLIPANISEPEIVNTGKQWDVDKLKEVMVKSNQLAKKNKDTNIFEPKLKKYIYREKFEKAVGDRARELFQNKKLGDLNIIINDIKLLKEIKLKEKPPQNNKMEQVKATFVTVMKYMRSPSTRSKGYLTKAGITNAEISDIFGSKKLNDFYPTPDEYIDTDSIIKSENILEGTCGLGFVVRRMVEINPSAKITAIEENTRAVVVGNKLLDGIAKIKEGDFFELPNKNNYDFIFLNPPFTSGYSRKDNFYVKFVIKLILMIDENKQNSKLNCQLLIPPRFLPSNMVLSEFFDFTLLDKCPVKELQKYCKELNTTIDDLEGITSGIYWQFLGFAKFGTTNFKIANIRVMTDIYN